MTEPTVADSRIAATIGQSYVGLCDQFLQEQLGRAYTVAELALFAETAVATLLASAYANFREIMGKEQSEAWLRRTLAQAAANVRVMGADALVKFDVTVRDMANKLHQRRQENAAAPSSPQAPAVPVVPPTCTCGLAADGSCASCLPVLGEIFKGTFSFMRQMGASAKKAAEVCQVCHVSQTDRALASLVPEALSLEVPADRREAFNHEMLAILHQMASSHGAQSIPLTEKAWKEAVKA